MILILFLVYLTDFCLAEYDEKNYETLTFNVALPSKNTYDETGIVSGDYRWYKNSSSKRNYGDPPAWELKGKGSDDWLWIITYDDQKTSVEEFYRD